jgi:hypothetical protein
MPSRGPPRSFGRARTLKQRSAETTGLEKTLLNSIGFLRRAGPAKAAGGAGTGWCRPAVDSVTVHGLAAPGALASRHAPVRATQNIKRRGACGPWRAAP